MKMSKAWLEPRQRILQRDGKRLSIRLEEEFWEQLEFCAKNEGLKLADLVFDLVGDNASANRSSLLRTFCARWMRNKLVKTHLANTSADIQGILTSCPIPCVIVSREKRLIAQNSAFGDKILGALIAPDKWSEADTVIQFSLAQPINKIVQELLGDGPPFVETNVAFSRGTAIVQMIGRFCLLNPRSTESSPLLCFLNLHRRRS